VEEHKKAKRPAAKINKRNRPGQYLAHLTPDMAGDWSADVTFQGPKWTTTLQLPANVKQQDA
jgi:hypothetical protein